MAAIQDFSIDQSTTAVINFTINVLDNEDAPWNPDTNPYQPLDLTGFTIEMEARTSYDSPIIVFQFSSTAGDFDLFQPTLGEFSLTILPATTSAFRFAGDSADLVYDILLTDTNGIVTRCFQGTLTVTREVIR